MLIKAFELLYDFDPEALKVLNFTYIHTPAHTPPSQAQNCTVCHRAFLNELRQIKSEPWTNKQIKTKQYPAALIFSPFDFGPGNVCPWRHYFI